MASAFGHAALGATLDKLLLPERRYWPGWVLASEARRVGLPCLALLGWQAIRRRMRSFRR